MILTSPCRVSTMFWSASCERRRDAHDLGGALHILAPQARVETMLSMAGVHKVIPIFREEEDAIRAFATATGNK